LNPPGQDGLSDHPQITPGIGVVTVDSIQSPDVQCRPSGAQDDRVTRKCGIAARVEEDIRSDRPDVVILRAELHRASRRIEADSDYVRELAFDPAFELDTLIVDVVVRVLAIPDAEAGKHAADRSGLEAALGLERRTLGAAPRERDGQSLACAQQIDGADAAAVGESVSVGVA